MKKIIEFRVLEEDAVKYLDSHIGITLGDTVRKIDVEIDSPLYEHIKNIHIARLQNEDIFVASWELKYCYSKKEISEASIFILWITAAFEPAGEECGTIYDESVSCNYCGANRKQLSDLILNLCKIPKNKDIARTIAYDEWIASERLSNLIKEHNLKGIKTRCVQHYKGILKQDINYNQIVIDSNPVTIIQPTQFGNNLFDDDSKGEFKCPLGHVAGLNLTSELYLSKGSWDGNDFSVTNQMVGIKRGLLRPRPLILVSKRVFDIFNKEKIKGCKFEIAYIK